MNPNENIIQPSDVFERLARQEHITGAELKEAMRHYAERINTLPDDLVPQLIERADLTGEDLADVAERLRGTGKKATSENAGRVHLKVLQAIEAKQGTTRRTS